MTIKVSGAPEKITFKSIYRHLGETFDRVDCIDRSEGEMAYERYHKVMQACANRYDVTIEQMTAAFVATSPNNDYQKNLRSAISVVDGFKKGHQVDQITVTTYRKCKIRAYQVLAGADFLDFTKGKKTRAFYQNILDPYDPNPVTVDGHMFAIATGRYLTMKEAVRTKLRYDDVATAVKLLAYENRLLANQVQAMLWFTWKRIYKPVAHDGQCELFSNDENSDHWRLNFMVEDIKPYPIKL